MSRYNPHFSNADQVFEAAQTFKVRCLFEGTSLLSGHRDIWAPANFDILISRYVDQPNAGKGTFYEKLVGHQTGRSHGVASSIAFSISAGAAKRAIRGTDAATAHVKGHP